MKYQERILKNIMFYLDIEDYASDLIMELEHLKSRIIYDQKSKYNAKYMSPSKLNISPN